MEFMLKKHHTNNESGMALVTCLLIMVVLAMIGIGITMDSTTEIKISGNLKNKAVSFQNADTGTTAAPEIIEDNLDNSRSDSPYTYSDDGANPVITVNTASFADLAENTTLDPAITISGSDIANDVNLPLNAKITVSKTKKLAAGNAIQMAAGYEGKGKSAAAGGVHVYFRCRSQDNQGGTISNTEIYYRHVPY